MFNSHDLPKLSWWRRYTANPHNVAFLKRVRLHVSLASIYSLIAIALFSQVALYLHDRTVAVTFAQAREAALMTYESTYKQRLLENRAELSRACTAWWFDLTHQDRKLDVPPRKK